MTTHDPFEAVALRLHALPTTEFVSARDDEARSLRATGEVDAAARVKALRRPSAAAGLVNALVRDDTSLVEELRQVGRRLRPAQQTADPAELRALDRERRALVSRCVDAAADLARRSGQSATAATLREIEQTFWAALVDAGAFAAVAAGALRRSLAPNGFGPVDLDDASAVAVDVEADPVASRRPAARRRDSRDEAVTDPPAARRDAESARALGAARHVLEEAEAALSAAEDAERQAAERATAAGEEVETLKRELADLRRQLTSTEAALREAARADRAGTTAQQAAQRSRREAARAVEAARGRVAGLDDGQ